MQSVYLPLSILAFSALTSGIPAQPRPSLGEAASFSVLGGSGVSNRGTTTIYGNAGVSPSNNLDGFQSVTQPLGETYRDTALARAAQRDNEALFASLAQQPCVSSALSGTLTPGVHCVPARVLSTTLVFDARGDPDAVFIVLVDGALTTASHSAVLAINGARDVNIFWRVPASATLGPNSRFLGNLLTLNDITAGAGAVISGRLLAQRGTVTLERNIVSLCCEPITVTASLPRGRVGVPYSATFTATGGTAPHRFTISSGSIEPLSLSPTGILTGTPTTAGRYSFIVTAADALGCSGSAVFEIEVELCPSSPIMDLPTGFVAQPYTYDFGPVSLRGDLPEGLIPDGTPWKPQRPGCSTFCSTEQTYRLCIECSPIVISTDTYTAGATFSATGGIGPYVFETPCGPIPPDPPPPGTCVDFCVKATDTVSGCHGTKHYRWCTPAITILPDSLPNGFVGVYYNVPITATDGANDYAVKHTSELPPGLKPLVKGKPTETGTFWFDVSVVDFPTITRKYTLEVLCPPITITPATLANGEAGIVYDVDFKAGPGANFTFAHDGTLPPGLDLSSTGRLLGTPPAPGTYTFRITASNGQCTSDPIEYALEIVPAAVPVAGDAPALSSWALLLLAASLAVTAIVTIRGGNS